MKIFGMPVVLSDSVPPNAIAFVQTDRKCARCGTPVVQPESCWWCMADLCAACWDDHGHCGHEEAEAVNRALRMLPSFESRRSLVLTVLHGQS